MMRSMETCDPSQVLFTAPDLVIEGRGWGRISRGRQALGLLRRRRMILWLLASLTGMPLAGRHHLHIGR